MSSFKIKLLTPIEATNGSQFLETTISEFYSQTLQNKDTSNIFDKKNSFSYTFDEKISIHKNGQKELSFSMLKNNWLLDTWEVNPFVNNIHNGTQLLLIDKYENETMFTVTQISYTIKKENIIYNVQCQDSFTYQLIRENDGYTITNDSSSESFIGAKTVDWWVVNKIIPECHIAYEYIPLFDGLYEDNSGNIFVFTEQEKLINVKKIIKQPYNKTKYSQYYEAIPFSVSGSNASAAIISLVEQVGLMINTRESCIKEENTRTTRFKKYFWFEPEKHEDPSNLMYSPNSSIESFSFDHSGNSLTTVLNVESNEINDEIVSLLPEVPPFFNSLFMSEDWEKSTYFDGYFKSICQQKILKNVNALDNDFYYSLSDNKGKEGYILIPLWTDNNSKKFKIPLYYNKISFNDNDNSSYIIYNDNRYDVFNTRWELCINNEEIGYNDTYRLISNEYLGTDQYVYIKIYIPSTQELVSLSSANIILNFSRDATEEELAFADIADKCPWLENKLIDFSYFYNHNIINKSEYNNLLSIFKNNLRVINGQLLVYAKQYYQAVHNATKTISNIINDIDSLFAAFHADVVDPYSSGGKIGDISYFQEAYDTVNTKYFNQTSDSILNYEELLTEYFNKYTNSQQRFLKNIYNFQKYFNEKIDWSGQTLYKHSVKLNVNDNIDYNTDGEYRYLSFDKPCFKILDDNFPYDRNNTLKGFLDIYDSTKTNKINTINRLNQTDYFKPALTPDSFVECDKTSGYNSLKEYYRRIYKAEKGGKIWSNYYTIDNKDTFIKYKEDDKFVYYGVQDLDVNYSWPETITFNETTLILDYIQVDLSEIINEYLYYKIKKDNNKLLGWTYHNNDTYNSATKEYLFEKGNNPLLNMLTPKCWYACFNSNDFNKYPEIASRAYRGDWSLPNYNDKLEEFYVEHFPITNLQYKGAKYILSPYTITVDGKPYKIKYQRVNENNQTIEDYINYWKANKSSDKEVKNPTEYFETYNIPLVTPYNENKFYRRVFTPDSLSIFTLKTEGQNMGDMFGNTYDKLYTGYIELDTINYGVAEDSFDKYYEYIEDRKDDFISKLEESNKNLTENPPKNPLKDNVTIATSGTKYLNSINPLTDKKDYFNYYGLVGLTYSAMIKENNSNLKYKDSWLSILSSTSVLNKIYTYKMLLLSEKNDTEATYSQYVFKDEASQNKFLEDNHKFSRIKYYPIDISCKPIDLSFLSENETISIQSLFENMGYENITINNNIISANIQKHNSIWNQKFVVFQQIDYKTDNVNNTSLFDKDTGMLKTENRYTLYKNQPIYNDNESIEVIFQDFPDLMLGFYIIKDQNESFVSIEPSDDINNLNCYTKNGLKFERIYTIPQLLQLKSKFYYMSLSQEADIENYSSTLTEINKPLYANKVVIKGNKINSLETETVNKYTIEVKTKPNSLETKTVIKYSNANGEVFDTTFTVTSTVSTAFSDLTNGEFWYKYHSNPNNAILFEKAAVIETNLTQYWEQAFVASKNCEFFLPEYWQTTVSGKSNYFNKDIIIKDDATDHVYLSNKFIPQVEIYKENGVSRLPLYSISHVSSEQRTYDSKTAIINNENKQLASTVFKNNKVFQNIFKELNENLDQYELQQIGYTNYYYRTSGGIRWENLVNTISSKTTQYDLLSGSYIMIYRILRTYLFKKTLTLYNETLRLHNNKWDEIYKNYSGVVLESKYENKDATTSEELFNLSTNAFKDLSQPERNYNISIIDLASLSGYEGQELCIGDSILLDADDYYDEYDDIKTTLSQYLFITDISYTLRKDSNISLTVNSIKYQEKLIQRLVKLIK